MPVSLLAEMDFIVLSSRAPQEHSEFAEIRHISWEMAVRPRTVSTSANSL